MKDFDEDTVSNTSGNTSFASILDVNLQRRRVLQGAIGMAFVGFFGVPLVARSGDAPANVSDGGDAGSGLGFNSIAISTEDTVRVSEGYVVRVLYAWGDPISNGPAFKQDASNTAAEQALQAGMHHDGMHFFPFPFVQDKNVPANLKAHDKCGLLCINHEYTDDGLLHTDGMNTWSADKVRKSQAAHGVSIIQLSQKNGRWAVVRPSRYARRVTAYTPIKLSGPAAGSEVVRTKHDPEGATVLGTFANCAHGYTPWGTYLTCEENWNGYFANGSGDIPPDQTRYGVSATGAGYRWHEFDERFDARIHPNETNRFGWVVEIDPFDPKSKPVKRTALGRMKHEGAMTTLAKDNRVVVYMGDDERFEYIYKFVSRDAFDPKQRARNRDLLDHGTLYVAKFNADGGGQWIALAHGQNGLTDDNGFHSQAEVLVKTRQAADRVGATKMDRPEWIAVHPKTKDVYCSLTNNSQRGTDRRPAVDSANPRADNVFGHIIRWHEDGGDSAAATFRWDVFALCGDPENADPNKQGNIKGAAFGCPDGLKFDERGRLWIQTDVSTSALNKGDFVNLGNNQMLCADVETGEIRRFLTGPKGCELTGAVVTPDGRTMFVNIQHPGETASERSNPENPKAVSAWPDGDRGKRPRSATIVIQRANGGVIGA